MKRSIAALGDVADIRTWSGIPFYFLEAASAAGFASQAWRLELENFAWPRRRWNAGHFLSGRGVGGFQYSASFLGRAERQISPELFATEVISFHPQFPRAESVRRAGGRLNHYLDAPFVAISSGRGLDLRLPSRIVAEAAELERKNFAASDRIVTMARWAAEVIVQECGAPLAKVATILPGANLHLPSDWNFPAPVGRAGRERDFTLGFVGKDWQRKGLPLLLSVRDDLVRRGWRARVLAAGEAPPELQRREGMEFSGFIDKQKDTPGFLRFLSACDLGCLFSDREALGISTLEFLRAGVPVAGFAHEGVADTLPPDAGFRFPRGATATEIADTLDGYLRDESKQADFRDQARRWSPQVTWARCVEEFQELWATGRVLHPRQPWRGLSS